MNFCSSCGDVKACMHKPDEIVTRAYWDALHQAMKRNKQADKRAKERAASR